MEAGVGGTDKSDVESVNEVRAMGICRSWDLGNRHSLRGKDEGVGTSSSLFIMVGVLTGSHHNHSSTL